MCGFLMVLSQPFPNFSGCYAHDRVYSQIVRRIPPEYIDADVSFFQLRRIAFQRLLDDIAQQRWVAFAIPKGCAGNNSLQLRLHRGRTGCGRSRTFARWWGIRLRCRSALDPSPGRTQYSSLSLSATAMSPAWRYDTPSPPGSDVPRIKSLIVREMRRHSSGDS